MAAPNRILALNLGTQTITLAEFQSNPGGGLVLARYQQGKILGDPAVDTTRVGQTKLEVQQLAGELGIKGGKVNYALASHVIFTRPVRLPVVGDASQVEQIVGFEAAQNVPYPIDQVVWDWQLLDAGTNGQMEVILAAIKADLLDEINDSVQSGGFTANLVDIAPMALYNAYRYNYPDEEGCTLLVDIGSRTTNLLFIEPGKIFPRRLNIGGSVVTSAIAKEFNLSFTAADARKTADGFVSLGAGYAEPEDAEVARISKIIRNQMTRLHQEIARSITFYRSEHGGSQPVRVLLAGGSASTPYMQEFFQEKLQMDVEFFNPLKNVSVSADLDIEAVGRISHTFGEVVGLALRSTVGCPMELNLPPATVVKQKKVAAQRPYMIAATVTLVIGLAAWMLFFLKGASVAREKAAVLREEAGALQPYDDKIKDAAKDVRDEVERAAPLLNAVHERGYWVNALNDLNKFLPTDSIWITEFKVPGKNEIASMRPPEPEPKQKAGAAKSAAGKKKDKVEPKISIEIKGLYIPTEGEGADSTKIVTDFAESLKASEYFEPPTETSDIKPTSPDTTKWAYEYSFPVYLKNPIRLQ